MPSVNIKKENGGLEIYIDHQKVLQISKEELANLPAPIKDRLVQYGLAVLLQREGAGVKSSSQIKEKIRARWEALKSGSWQAKKPTSSRASSQKRMISALPKELRAKVIEELAKAGELLLSKEEVEELLA